MFEYIVPYFRTIEVQFKNYIIYIQNNKQRAYKNKKRSGRL